MPEAYSESEELLSEVARVRPEWLCLAPDETLYRRLRFDWKRSRGGFWDRARSESDLERARIDIADDGARAFARAEAHERRDHAKGMPQHFQSAPLEGLRAKMLHGADLSSDAEFEPWRYAAMIAWMHAIDAEQHPYQDWLAGRVLLPLLSVRSPDLENFWLRDVDKKRMPRAWLRFAFEHLQQFHKITDGTPADAQLATYLVEADLFISADRNFVRFVERCASEAPVRVARAELAPGGASAIEYVLAKLAK